MPIDFNPSAFIEDTARRVDQDLLTNRCNFEYDEEIQDAVSEPSELDRITRRIELLTGQIREHRSGDTLRVLIRQHIAEVEEQVNAELQEQSELMSQFAPILKLPTSPLGVVKWVKKFVLGDIYPQVQAAIRMAARLIRLASAISDLIVEIEQAVRYLEELARTVDGFAQSEAFAALRRLQFGLQAAIQNEISNAICSNLRGQPFTIIIDGIEGETIPGVSANDVRAFYETLNTIGQSLFEIQQIQGNIRGVLDRNFNQVRDLQVIMSEVSGVPPAINTTDLDSYVESIIGGDADQYLADTQVVMDIDPVTNVTAPFIEFSANNDPVSGNTDVFTQLRVNEGTWEGEIDDTRYEWYAGDDLVANTQLFTPGVNEIDRVIRATVIRENFVSLTEATTDPIERILNPFVFTSNIVQPSVTGTAEPGQTLTCSQGLWDGTGPLTYSYQWQYAKTGEAILGETNNTYTIDNEDLNRSINCRVTATNLLGANSINSTSSAIVTAAP